PAPNAAPRPKGPVAGMTPTEGSRDITPIARHQRVEHYSIMQELPWQNRPLVKRRFRKVVGGRLVPPRGEELEPLDEEAVRRAAVGTREQDADAISALLLLFYLNPAREERSEAIV